MTVQTSAETEFFRKLPDGGLEPITFDDLAIDDRITAHGERDGEVFNADRVVVLPPPQVQATRSQEPKGS